MTCECQACSVVCVQGDVRCYDDVREALEGADVVFHMASFGMSGKEQVCTRVQSLCGDGRSSGSCQSRLSRTHPDVLIGRFVVVDQRTFLLTVREVISLLYNSPALLIDLQSAWLKLSLQNIDRLLLH